MPQSLLTGQLKEKPTYRFWCLYSSFVHGYSPLYGKIEQGQSMLQHNATHDATCKQLMAKYDYRSLDLPRIESDNHKYTKA